MSHFEKTPLTSKKFIAFLVGEVSWKVIVGFEVLYGASPLTVILPTIIVAGFLEAVYVGGQAALDYYVRVASLVIPGDVAPKDPPEAG